MEIFLNFLLLTSYSINVPQVWKNVEEVHKSGSAILELSSSLSQLFEKLYLKQVCLHLCTESFASAS